PPPGSQRLLRTQLPRHPRRQEHHRHHHRLRPTLRQQHPPGKHHGHPVPPREKPKSRPQNPRELRCALSAPPAQRGSDRNKKTFLSNSPTNHPQTPPALRRARHERATPPSYTGGTSALPIAHFGL